MNLRLTCSGDTLLTRGSRSFGLFIKQFALNGIETEGLTNAREAASMNGRRAELFQQATVLRCRIAFVSSKIISGVDRIEFAHQRVAGGLGNDRSGRNAGGKRVAFDYASLRRRANPCRYCLRHTSIKR